MMYLLSLSQNRYSVRSYSDQSVEPEKLDYLLEVARLAPSAVNKQPWRFVVVQSDEKKTALRDCYNRDWFKEAPIYIVVCGNHTESWKRGFDNKDHCDIDIAIATEHIVLAAEELGLGCCWVCNFDAQKCSEILQLNSDEEAIVILPIGYAKDDNRQEKKRKGKNEIISFI